MKKFTTEKLVIKKFTMEKIAMAGQENINSAFKSIGENLHKNHRGFVVIGQK